MEKHLWQMMQIHLCNETQTGEEGDIERGEGILDVNFSFEVQLIKLLMSIFQFD